MEAPEPELAPTPPDRTTVALPFEPLAEDDPLRVEAIAWIETMYGIPVKATTLVHYPALQPKSLEASDLVRLGPTTHPGYFCLDKADGTMHSLLVFRDQAEGRTHGVLVDRSLRVYKLPGFRVPTSRNGAEPVQLTTAIEGELVRRDDDESLLWLAFRPVWLLGFPCKDLGLLAGLRTAAKVLAGDKQSFVADAVALRCKISHPIARLARVYHDPERPYPVDGLILVPRVKLGALGRVADEYKWKGQHTIDLMARIWRMRNGKLRMTFMYYVGVKGCVRYFDFWDTFEYRGLPVQSVLQATPRRDELGMRAHKALQAEDAPDMLTFVVECSFRLKRLLSASELREASALDARARKKLSKKRPLDRLPRRYGWRLDLNIERIRDDKKYPNEHLIIVSALESQGLNLAALSEAVRSERALSGGRGADDVKAADAKRLRAMDKETQVYIEEHQARREKYHESLRGDALANKAKREAFARAKAREKRKREGPARLRKLRGAAKEEVLESAAKKRARVESSAEIVS